MDWKSNPKEFIYKLPRSRKQETATISNVTEFGISTTAKYVRATVNIDRSSNDANKISTTKSPIFKEETLFLKTLIEGDAILYSYEDRGLRRYFFKQKDESEFTQLVFKYYLTQTNEISKNFYYKQQLWNALKCSKISMSKISKIDYKQKDLLNFFTLYNNCNSDTPVKSYVVTKKRKFLNLTAKVGINQSSLTVNREVMYYENEMDFDPKTSIRFGVEAEILLPFNKNKWSLFLEPTYHAYKSTGSSGGETAEIDYKSIELPFGVRYYLFLDKKGNSKIFMNLAYVADISFNSLLKSSSPYFPDLELKTAGNLAIGLGFKLKNYSIEVRHDFIRGILENHGFYTEEYSKSSIIFGYKFL